MNNRILIAMLVAFTGLNFTFDSANAGPRKVKKKSTRCEANLAGIQDPKRAELYNRSMDIEETLSQLIVRAAQGSKNYVLNQAVIDSILDQFGRIRDELSNEYPPVKPWEDIEIELNNIEATITEMATDVSGAAPRRNPRPFYLDDLGGTSLDEIHYNPAKGQSVRGRQINDSRVRLDEIWGLRERKGDPPPEKQ